MEIKDLVELNAQELEQVNGGISWIGGVVLSELCSVIVIYANWR